MTTVRTRKRRATSYLLAAATSLLLADVVPTPAAAAAAAVGPDIRVRTPQSFALKKPRLIFSTVAEESRPAKKVGVANRGTTPMAVTVAITGTDADSFFFAPGQPTTFAVNPGQRLPVAVRFLPPDATPEVREATLAITSDDADTPLLNVLLRGVDAPDYEGSGEPGLAEIVSTFGYGTTVLAGNDCSSGPVGDEVLTPYLRRAVRGKPVGLLPLARFTGRSAQPSGQAGWFVRKSGQVAKRNIQRFAGGTDPSGGENQRLLPRALPGSSTRFSPRRPFGLFESDVEFSDDTLNGRFQVHNVRIFPAETAGGRRIPYAWIVAGEIGQVPGSALKNCDFNDYVFLLTNARRG